MAAEAEPANATPAAARAEAKRFTENFLASVFLSLQQPFRMDDLIEVAGTTGFVHLVTDAQRFG